MAPVLTTKVDEESTRHSSRHSSRQPSSRQPPSRQLPSRQTPSRQYLSIQPSGQSPDDKIRCIYCSDSHWINNCLNIPNEYRGLCVNC